MRSTHPGRRVRRPPACRGVTLVELLVVVGIIAVLFSLLLPTLGRVRERAREAECRTRLRQLITAFHAFAADHDRHLPGGYFDIGNPDPDRQCWLMGNVRDWRQAPQTGTIFPYVKEPLMYRCPSLTEAPGSGVAGKTSNGKFDFSMFLSFTGARLGNVRQTARYRRPSDGRFIYLPTPVLCEEYTDHLNVSNIEGGHATTDRMGHQHGGGGHYASIDGSVHWFVEDLNANTDNWFSQAPSGNWEQLGEDVRWGWWNSR
jgi:prepilin-type N-terminal cleavage/methylation domain-containing protein